MNIIFLLIITCYQPDVMAVYGNGVPVDTREKIIVSSPESAAVVLWRKNQGPLFNTSYSGVLYKVDVEKGTVELVKIPGLFFKEGL